MSVFFLENVQKQIIFGVIFVELNTLDFSLNLVCADVETTVDKATIFYALLVNSHHTGAAQFVHTGHVSNYSQTKHILQYFDKNRFDCV